MVLIHITFVAPLLPHHPISPLYFCVFYCVFFQIVLLDRPTDQHRALFCLISKQHKPTSKHTTMRCAVDSSAVGYYTIVLLLFICLSSVVEAHSFTHKCRSNEVYKNFTGKLTPTQHQPIHHQTIQNNAIHNQQPTFNIKEQ